MAQESSGLVGNRMWAFLRVVYFVPVACLGSCETITSGGRQGRKFTLSRSHCTAVID